jgi:para-nitrobenzyl esterase
MDSSVFSSPARANGKNKTLKRYPLILVMLLNVFSLTLLASMTLGARSFDPTIVQTVNGTIKGLVTSTTRQFLGIPYAAPPVGNLRWRAPQPVTSWQGTRSATTFGNICTQAQGQTVIGSEDCLYLNVYTPAVLEANLPVMVWIHGGAFVSGAGSQYDPTALVTRGNVIVVTINYRLGSFGFLALPGLSNEVRSGSSGNYGLLDQQAALHWVRANIARFGGNTNNVTLFGESAGGAAVCDQIASPQIGGFFQKAITESGPCEAANIATPTLAAARTTGSTFATSVGCTGANRAIVACLRDTPASTLVAHTNASARMFAPNVDGSILPRSVKSALALGLFNHVPIIEGSNRNEGDLFTFLLVFATGKAVPLTDAQYTGLLEQLFGSNAATVQAQYPVSKYGSADEAYANMLTDFGYTCPGRTADRLLSTQVPTFAYEFNDPNPPGIPIKPPDFTIGDYHSSELQYIFQGGVASLITGTIIPLNTAETALSDQMIDYWTTFALTGNPNSNRTPHWPLYRNQADQFQSLTSAGNGPGPITTFASEHQCGFWQTLGF